MATHSDEPTTTTRQYTEEEVSEILRRALARQHNAGAVSHQELVDVAREVGVSDAELRAAAEEIEAERAHVDYRGEARKRALREFLGGALAYAVVNVVIRTVGAAAAVMTAMPWLHIVLFIWTISLALQFLRVIFPGAAAEHARRRAERQRAAERKARDAARAARAAQQSALGQELAHNAEEFGTAVQRGVSTLLATLAHEINARVEQRNAAPTQGWQPPPGAQPQQGAQPAQQESSTWVRVNTADAASGAAREQEPAGVEVAAREGRAAQGGATTA